MPQKFIAAGLLVGALALSACAAAAPASQPTAAQTQPTMVLPAASAAPGAVTEPAPNSAPDAANAQLGLGVSATGEIAARRTAELSFRVPGTIASVLVEEGATVVEGQELASLDTAELQLQVKQAEAQLAGAQANYERLVEGASPEEVAAARAQVAQAQAALRQARGSVTDQDIAAAEAALQQALARQAEVEAGPKSADLTQAQSAVQQAQSNLEIQRTNLSAAKTNAELQIELAANAVRDAQDVYSEIYWKNRELERKLDQFDVDLPDEATDAEEQALRGVQSAEARLEAAKLAVEQARQNEIDGLAAAEAQVDTAEANLQRVLEGATTDLRAAAAAGVAQARATLEKLKGDQRAGALAAAQAGVSGAQANLERVAADPSTATLAGALAQIQAAEAGLEAAKLTLDKATLRAPFGGVIAQLSVDPGDVVTGSPAGGAAIQLVDISELRVEVNISDTDVARVREGMPVDVRVDAVSDQTFSGTVTYIAPTATVQGTVRTYAVRVTLDSQEGLRAGMSARVSIAVEG